MSLRVFVFRCCEASDVPVPPVTLILSDDDEDDNIEVVSSTGPPVNFKRFRTSEGSAASSSRSTRPRPGSGTLQLLVISYVYAMGECMFLRCCWLKASTKKTVGCIMFNIFSELIEGSTARSKYLSVVLSVVYVSRKLTP
jgi:hypothetical protein